MGVKIGGGCVVGMLTCSDPDYAISFYSVVAMHSRILTVGGEVIMLWQASALQMSVCFLA